MHTLQGTDTPPHAVPAMVLMCMCECECVYVRLLTHTCPYSECHAAPRQCVLVSSQMPGLKNGVGALCTACSRAPSVGSLGRHFGGPRGLRGALLYIAFWHTHTGNSTIELNSTSMQYIVSSCRVPVSPSTWYKHTTTPEEPRGVDTHSQNHE